MSRRISALLLTTIFVIAPLAGCFGDEEIKYKKNLSDLNGALRPGIVHRIDKDTSGLLVIAKNNLAHANLGVQFSNHTIKRKYIENTM